MKRFVSGHAVRRAERRLRGSLGLVRINILMVIVQLTQDLNLIPGCRG
jgi:hypothetical protein